MLHLKKLLAAKPKEHVVSQLRPMLTPWGETLNESCPLPEHPTPSFKRYSYLNLNGIWRCAFVESTHTPDSLLEEVVCAAAFPEDSAFDQNIVVPFSPEAHLSGVGRSLQPTELLWYKRSFVPPACNESERVLLHFQAVDYACAVYVNGKQAGTHSGGYIPFAIDITHLLQSGENELALCVADPSEFGEQPRGKQRFDRGDIWYTAQSGIWQTVWMEVVPASYIVSVTIEADALTGILAVGARLELAEAVKAPLTLVVYDGEEEIVRTTCEAEETCALAVHVPHAINWTPENPHLYTLKFHLGTDEVESYCGFRTIEVRKDEAGHARLFLNGQPYFVRGVLDQGYWSDGLLTAPSDEALIYDIESMRNAGFNLMRKHIKVECERWYYHCDRLGMLVWQDMVSGGAAELNSWVFSYKPSLFKASWRFMRDTTRSNQQKLGAGNERYRKEWMETCRQTITTLANHPCIVTWTLFNEGWGQFNAKDAYERAHAIDPTRPICATSGWYDQGAGEIRGVHNYFRDFGVWKMGLRGRAFVITEFGGFAHRVEGHSSLDMVYGYEVYDTLDEWFCHTRDLLEEVESLQVKGLAGYVLTQVSDIEEETNGILTYDRRVNKMRR